MTQDLLAGVYRHYKGPLYLVFGYGHDANAEDLYVSSPGGTEFRSVGQRDVVMYIGLELTDANLGPRFAVRTYEDFFAWVHPDGSICFTGAGETNGFCFCAGGGARLRRFTYVGPTWEGQR